jgi:hypothetical protein
MGNCATDCKNCGGDGKEFVDTAGEGLDVRSSVTI